MKRVALERKTELKRVSDAPRECLDCGKAYTPRRVFQKYCNETCAASYRRKNNAPEWTCEVCDKTFKRYPTGSAPRFCSMECRTEGWHGRPRNVICGWCKKSFETRVRSQQYCCQECSVRGRYGKKRPPKWSLSLKGEQGCRNCGRFASHVHHIVPRSKSRDGKDDIKTNGMPLCFDCHRGWHDRRVTVAHNRLSDDELLAAIRRTNVVWVSKNYPDEPLAELLTLYEVKTGRRLESDAIAEPLSVRLERLELHLSPIPEGGASS